MCKETCKKCSELKDRCLCEPPKGMTKIWLMCKEASDDEGFAWVTKTKTIPTMKAVCPRCKGEGTHTNPDIDGDGLTQDDFIDEDFRESYRSGVYDVTCEECEGLRVIDTPDLSYLSELELKQYERNLEHEASEEREHAAELYAERNGRF